MGGVGVTLPSIASSPPNESTEGNVAGAARSLEEHEAAPAPPPGAAAERRRDVIVAAAKRRRRGVLAAALQFLRPKETVARPKQRTPFALCHPHKTSLMNRQSSCSTEGSGE